eukprot:1161512-Pelagomonas_calceolata.AAC.10
MSVPCSQAAEQVVQGEAQPAGAANPGDRNKAGVVSGEHSTFIVGGQPSEGEDRDGEQHSQAEERQKRGNEKSRRRGLSAKRLHISGSGQLPRLDTYLSELAARPSPSAVTQYLAEGLYKHHEPPQIYSEVPQDQGPQLQNEALREIPLDLPRGCCKSVLACNAVALRRNVLTHVPLPDLLSRSSLKGSRAFTWAPRPGSQTCTAAQASCIGLPLRALPPPTLISTLPPQLTHM